MKYKAPTAENRPTQEYRVSCDFGIEEIYLIFQQTFNCQLFYGHGIDYVVETIADEFDASNTAIKMLKAALLRAGSHFGKPLLMFDMSEQNFEYIKNFFPKAVYNSSSFVSTNGSNRVFVIIKISNL